MDTVWALTPRRSSSRSTFMAVVVLPEPEGPDRSTMGLSFIRARILVHGGVDALLVVGVTLGQKGGRVPPDFFVDLTELIGQSSLLYLPCAA